ncbi:unnamed protein product, partial [Prorocentrum cordatum]
ALRDSALHVLMALWSVMESTGLIPKQAWESSVSRPYLAASAFAGAGDAVWRQALRSEAA